jgi:hypothetical protein
VIDLDVFVRGGDLELRNAALRGADDVIVTAPEALDPGGIWTITAEDVGRAGVPVPADQTMVVSFGYLDRGRGSVHVTIRGPDVRPVVDSWRLAGSDRWLERRIVVSSRYAGFLDMTVRGTSGTPVLLRDLGVEPAR